MCIYTEVHVMPPSGLAILDAMMSPQTQPEKGLALLHLLLVISFSQTQESVCRRRGDPENPVLSKDGDIMLGGFFDFHRMWKVTQDTYLHKPKPVQCIR